jgi:hypothetical protein
LDRWVGWLVRRSVDRLVGGWVGRLVGWSVGWWVRWVWVYGERKYVSGTYTDLNCAHRTSSAERAGAAHCKKKDDEIGSTPVALLVPYFGTLSVEAHCLYTSVCIVAAHLVCLRVLQCPPVFALRVLAPALARVPLLVLGLGVGCRYSPVGRSWGSWHRDILFFYWP